MSSVGLCTQWRRKSKRVSRVAGRWRKDRRRMVCGCWGVPKRQHRRLRRWIGDVWLICTREAPKAAFK